MTCRIDELEAELAPGDGSVKPAETSTDTSAAKGASELGEHSSRQELVQRLKEVEAREQAVHALEEKVKAGKQKEVKDKEAKEQQALYSKVSILDGSDVGRQSTLRCKGAFSVGFRKLQAAGDRAAEQAARVT